MKIKLAYNLKEAADATGLSERTLKRAIGTGALKARKSDRDDEGNPRGVYVITAKALEEFIDGLAAA